MVTIQVQNLINFVAEVFSHSQSSPAEARRIASYLTTANLTGHDSHGVIRVPVYIRWKKMGSVVPDQTVELVVDTPSLAVVDGKFGYGQTVTPQAVRIGIEKCRKAGLAAVALRNAGHIGRVGDWAEMAAAEGLVSVHFVNARVRCWSLLTAAFSEGQSPAPIASLAGRGSDRRYPRCGRAGALQPCAAYSTAGSAQRAVGRRAARLRQFCRTRAGDQHLPRRRSRFGEHEGWPAEGIGRRL